MNTSTRTIRAGVLVAASVFLGGCVVSSASQRSAECAATGDWVPCADTVRYMSGPRLGDVNIAQASHAAADALLERAGELLGRDKSIIAASFVDIDELEKTSTLGRVLADQFAGRLAFHGYPVVEMKMRESIFMKRGEGEFVLSRDLRQLSIEHDAQAVIAGTYAVADDTLYVSAKLIRATDSQVLAAYDVRLPIGPDTRRMLR